MQFKQINFKTLFNNNWIHFFAIGLFLLTTVIYFYPQFSGYGLEQSDVVQWKGMITESEYYYNTHGGEVALWSNTMFGGMPTYQFFIGSKGNLLVWIYKGFHFFFDSPAGLFFGFLIGFYIMLICMKIKPKLAILGAFMYAFSSYFMLLLQVGHDTKAIALGFAPMVIGGFYVAYRGKVFWGLLLSALFMGLELLANHPQITYYLGMILVALGVWELIRYIKMKQFFRFVKISGGLILVYLFAAGLSFGKLYLTYDYAKHTIRGGNDISIHPDGTHSHTIKTSGLDKDYILQWSYGIEESMTLISPNIKGGGSSAFSNSQFSELLRQPEFRRDAQLIASNNVYWGNQPFTSGPVYLGIIVVFLALLGMIYLKNPIKWPLLIVSIIALLLSWGKNFMGFSDFFIDYIPLYNKFRAVSMILIIIQITVPLLAILFIDRLFKEKERIKNNIKPFYIASGVTLGLIIVLTFTGLGSGYLSDREREFLYSYPEQVEAQIMQMNPAQLQEQGIDINNPQQMQQIVSNQMERVNEQFDTLISARKSIYRSSMGRTIFFLVIAIILVGLFLKTTVKKIYIIGGLLVFTLFDLVPIDLNYLNNKKSDGRNYDYWVENAENEFPLSPTLADKQILQAEVAADSKVKELVENVKVERNGPRGRVNQNELWLKKFQVLGSVTNYRVYDPALGFNSSQISYFHKALNGYHGAKLRRIQNIKDFYINNGNMDVLNMLNVKYFIQEGKAVQNPEAMGNAWLIRNVNVQPDPNHEILALGNIFKITNLSDQTLFVNEQKVTSDTVSGRENIVLYKNDSLPLKMSQIMRSGISAAFVQDVNGNTNWIPLTELEKDSLNSFKPLVKVKLIHDFEPKNEVIIGKAAAQQLSSLEYSGIGTIELSSYAPNALHYKVDVDETQFAVFSEMYYPDGWNAYINGEKVDILRVNYLLRGIELPKGKYELVMKFEVPLYHLSVNIAFAGSLLLLLLIGGLFVKDFLLKKKEEK